MNADSDDMEVMQTIWSQDELLLMTSDAITQFSAESDQLVHKIEKLRFATSLLLWVTAAQLGTKLTLAHLLGIEQQGQSAYILITYLFLIPLLFKMWQLVRRLKANTSKLKALLNGIEKE